MSKKKAVKRKPAVKKRKTKKALKKSKKLKKVAKTLNFTFLCNEWRETAKFFTYRNGMAGQAGYGCEKIPGRIKKSEVASVKVVGSCSDGGPLYEITLV